VEFAQQYYIIGITAINHEKCSNKNLEYADINYIEQKIKNVSIKNNRERSKKYLVMAAAKQNRERSNK